MVKQLSNQESWKPWQGVAYLCVVFAILVFQGFVLEYYLGLIGVFIGQLLFLASAIGVTKLHKTPLKEVFPIGKLTVRDIFGIIVFGAGAIVSNLALSGLGMFLFPKSMENMANLSSFLYDNGLPAVVIVLIISVMPAICEEAIMRGAFLSHFRGLKKDWIVCLIVGLAFGALHTSDVKFLSTGFLGACLAYLVIKKNNILLACIVHLMNNLLSSVAGVTSSTEQAEAAIQTVDYSSLSMLGSFLLIGFLAPILLYLGAILLKTTKHSGVKLMVSIGLSVALLVAGIALPVIDVNNRAVMSSTWSFEATDSESVFQFDVEESKEYNLLISGMSQNGGIDIRIEDANGELVTTDGFEAGLVNFNQNLNLESGSYKIIVVENTDAASASVNVEVKLLNVD